MCSYCSKEQVVSQKVLSFVMSFFFVLEDVFPGTFQDTEE